MPLDNRIRSTTGSQQEVIGWKGLVPARDYRLPRMSITGDVTGRSHHLAPEGIMARRRNRALHSRDEIVNCDSGNPQSWHCAAVLRQGKLFFVVTQGSPAGPSFTLGSNLIQHGERGTLKEPGASHISEFRLAFTFGWTVQPREIAATAISVEAPANPALSLITGQSAE